MTMSFNVPPNAPAYSQPRNHATTTTEDTHWRPNRNNANSHSHTHSRAGSGFGAKLGEMLKSEKELPMYKDKPSYAVRRRRWFWFGGRRRIWAGLGVLCLVVFWWMRTRSSFSSSVPGKNRQLQFGSIPGFGGHVVDSQEWDVRRQAVKDVFMTSWDGYEKYAWGMDEYNPISRKGKNMVEGGLGWIIVDSLDTAMIMNLTSRVAQARKWISTSLHYTADTDVNTFETTIRMLGGLLSAHYLSTTYPDLAPLKEDDVNQPGEDLYIEKATDLADRLLGAYETPSGIPYSTVNLNTSQGFASRNDAGSSSTAEAATLQLEMKYLAKLTGEALYWERAEVIMQVIDAQQREDGLLPIFISPQTGTFRGQNIRFGSRGDSYYEYLIKQYLQTANREPVYLDMWNESLEGVKKHLIAYTKHSNLTVLAERENGLAQALTPKMDHLVCFMPGTIVLGLTGGQTVAEAKARLGNGWTKKHDENLRLAEELMKTCWGMYKVTPTGLAPEITYFKLDSTPRVWEGYKDPTWSPPVSDELTDSYKAEWRKDYDIHSQDVHSLQRPETVESLLYMYRITQDPKYRDWGWEMFSSFREHTKVVDEVTGQVYAFSSLDSVMDKPVSERKKRDNMESFWMAETLKYFYLLFSPDDFLDLTQIVFNTEAHPFPRFDIQGSKVLKTNWARLPRQNTAAAAAASATAPAVPPTAGDGGVPPQQPATPPAPAPPEKIPRSNNDQAQIPSQDHQLQAQPAPPAPAPGQPATPQPPPRQPRERQQDAQIPDAGQDRPDVPNDKTAHLHEDEEHREQYERLNRAVPSDLSKGA